MTGAALALVLKQAADERVTSLENHSVSDSSSPEPRKSRNKPKEKRKLKLIPTKKAPALPDLERPAPDQIASHLFRTDLRELVEKYDEVTESNFSKKYASVRDTRVAAKAVVATIKISATVTMADNTTFESSLQNREIKDDKALQLQRQHSSVIENRVIETLARKSKRTHKSDTKAAAAPEEVNRVPMLDRGVSITFLRAIVDELQMLASERGDERYAVADSGHFLNGVHTDPGALSIGFTRARDPFCVKACTLPTGTSFVETCMDVGLTTDFEGKHFFGRITRFLSYAWQV